MLDNQTKDSLGCLGLIRRYHSDMFLRICLSGPPYTRYFNNCLCVAPAAAIEQLHYIYQFTHM